MHIILADASNGGLARWSADPAMVAMDAHPLTGGFGRSYYPAVMGPSRRDASLAVIEGERLVLVVPCSIGEGVLDWYGLPLRLHLAGGLSSGEELKAVGLAVEHLVELMQANRIARVLIEEAIASRALSPLGLACLSRDAVAGLALNAEIDLADGEAGLRRALRKRFRSLVNWGRRSLTLAYVNSAEPDRARFDAYQQFHLQVAGRTTRPQASWDAMFDWVAHGGGELTLGRLESGELVAATLVVDGRDVAYYASGVYDRERFDKPISHYPIYDAILRARERGLKRFDLGAFPLPREGTEKERAIGYFKRGFAGRISTSMTWTLGTSETRE